MTIKNQDLSSRVDCLNRRLSSIEKRLEETQKQIETKLRTLQGTLLRIKNGEKVSDDFVLNSRSYQDLPPEKAFEIYQKMDRDFLLLDVSSAAFHPEEELPEAVKIPLEQLGIRYNEINNKATSIMVISEKGVRSIIACELLASRGYCNLNNVSGGYKFWPPNRNKLPLNARSA